MTDAELRELFALLAQPAVPRAEFAERLLADIDAVAAGSVTDQDASRARATADVSGTLPEQAYLPEQRAYLPEEKGDPTSSPSRPRARRSRIIVALAAAAVIVVVVAVVVTRPTTSHRRGTAPTAPAASPTTAAPAGPTITITPSTGLSDGQVVHVVVRGSIGGQYVVGECTAAVTFPIGNLGCDNGSVKPLIGDYMASLGTNTLTGSADVVVHKSFHAFGTAGDSGLIDCSTDRTGCIILVWGGDPLRQSSTQEARAVLSFAP
jgi:hypothetical protein